MKKKIIIFTILTILTFNLLCVTSIAANEMAVTVGSDSANAGETVEIPIVLSGNTGFSNLAIEIGYNSDVMTLTNAASPVSGASFTTAPDFTANPYNMQWDSASDVTYNGTLAVLTFQIKANAANGTYPVTVNFYKGRDGNNVDGDDVNYKANYDPLVLTYKNGSIIVGKQREPGIEIVNADTQNLSFSIRLSADKYIGDIWTGLYDDSGRVVSVKKYSAAENVNISFEKGISGAYVKIMWWESSSLRPLCNAQVIHLH